MASGAAFDHALAKLRRLGKGVWKIYFGVYGYDPEFLMHAPGDIREQFAIEVTAVTLARKLKVKRKDIFHHRSEWESP